MIEIIIIYNDNNDYYCDYYHDHFRTIITISIVIIKLSSSLHYLLYHMYIKYCKYDSKDTK